MAHRHGRDWEGRVGDDEDSAESSAKPSANAEMSTSQILVVPYAGNVRPLKFRANSHWAFGRATYYVQRSTLPLVHEHGLFFYERIALCSQGLLRTWTPAGREVAVPKHVRSRLRPGGASQHPQVAAAFDPLPIAISIMAVLSLPLNFGNSFWSQGYRRGLEVLFDKLDQVSLSPYLMETTCFDHRSTRVFTKTTRSSRLSGCVIPLMKLCSSQISSWPISASCSC